MTSKQQQFAPRVSIVTGAGSGIGKAIASELVARGSHVVVADLDEALATAAAEELGHDVTSAVVDVADADAVERLVGGVLSEHGRLDVMVNNAGVAFGGLHEELTRRHWDKALAVNLGGVINGVAAAYPVMQRQRSGHILNTGSLAGLIPAPVMLPYTTTKHAVVGLSTALRAEAAGQGVSVSVLCPGFVDTPLLDNVYEAPASFGGSSVRRQVRLIQPRFLTAATVARRAVDGLAAGKAIIPVGALAHLLWRLDRLSPELSGRLLRMNATAHRRMVDKGRVRH